MRLILAIIGGVIPLLAFADDNLSSKVVRLTLSQDQPAEIRLGTHGITTIEFPEKIEALDGFGFSTNPAPDSPDLFQISFNKGTNFLSLKAVRTGVEGNLTVVLGGKVYALYCKEEADPCFVVIFQESEGGHSGDTGGRTPQQTVKQVSPARLLGFLDKIKAFPTLKVSAPEVYQNMDVAEPNTNSGVNGIEVNLKRVIRDDALDSLGFEIQLANRTDKDFFYDPEGFGVRVGNDVYQQSVSDAGGLVPSGKAQTAFFIVTGSANGGRNDLAVTNKFEVVVRPVQGEADPKKRAATEWQEPPGTLPIAEPATSDSSGDQGSGAIHPKSSSGKRTLHRVRKESKKPPEPMRSPAANQVAEHAE
jgi:hypothetical protein